MGRKRKGPWKRKQDGHWYTTSGKRLVKVADGDKSYEAAYQEFARILSTESREAVNPATLTVAALLDRYLEFCHVERADKTYR